MFTRDRAFSSGTPLEAPDDVNSLVADSAEAGRCPMICSRMFCCRLASFIISLTTYLPQSIRLYLAAFPHGMVSELNPVPKESNSNRSEPIGQPLPYSGMVASRQ